MQKYVPRVLNSSSFEELAAYTLPTYLLSVPVMIFPSYPVALQSNLLFKKTASYTTILQNQKKSWPGFLFMYNCAFE